MGRDSPSSRAFAMAPMSGLIRVMTWVLFVLPAGMLAAAIPLPGYARALPLGLGAFVLVLYASVWFYWRPGSFVLSPEGFEAIFPVRRRFVPAADIIGAEVTSFDQMRAEFGTLMRVGAGGLWGGFGLAWSSRGQHLAMYVSRHSDGFVLLRCRTRSWLITPEDPDRFVREVARIAGG